jgi:hypothetical protein
MNEKEAREFLCESDRRMMEMEDVIGVDAAVLWAGARLSIHVRRPPVPEGAAATLQAVIEQYLRLALAVKQILSAYHAAPSPPTPRLETAIHNLAGVLAQNAAEGSAHPGRSPRPTPPAGSGEEA